MRRFGLVGMALVLFAGSATAQQVVTVTTVRECCTKTTTIEKAPPPPTLDQLGHMPCAPRAPLCCMLADQPALLYRLAVMNALQMNAGIGLAPRADELPRPAKLDEKKPEEKKDEKGPVPAAMMTLKTTEWDSGSRFTDDGGRHWCLIKGCPLPEKMPQMRGWLLESDGKKTYFLHETGNLYSRVAP
jgi:hypothetical protein